MSTAATLPGAVFPGAGLYPSPGNALAPGALLCPSPRLFPGPALYPGASPGPPPLPRYSWPDVELALCDLLAGLGTCGIETRPNLASTLPYIRVTRTGGTDDRVTDVATVSVDVFAASRSDAKATAERTRQLLVFGLPVATDHGVLDWAATITGPSPLPPTNSGSLRMAVASYRISMRRQASQE